MARSGIPKKLKLLENDINAYLDKFTYRRLHEMSNKERDIQLANDLAHIIDKYYPHIDLTDNLILTTSFTTLEKIKKLDITLLLRLYTDPNNPKRDYHSFIDKTYYPKGEER